MNNFIALKNGTLINLGVVAYIYPTPGAMPGRRGVEIVFPSINVDHERGKQSSLTLSVPSGEVSEFFAALEERGIDATSLRRQCAVPPVGAPGMNGLPVSVLR